MKMNFGSAIVLLENGNLLAREGWNGRGMFVCKQVPCEIPDTIVPNMQSLPQKAKDEFIKRFNHDGVIFDSISYCSQMIIVDSNNQINSWVPSSSDIFATDWVIYE